MTGPLRLLGLLLLVGGLTVGCSGADLPFAGGEAETTATVAQPPAATAEAPPLEPGPTGCDHRPPPEPAARPAFDVPPPSPLVGEGPWSVVMETSCGRITIDLDVAAGGRATAAFAALARAGFYDGLPFHRVVPGFVIQGGDPLGTGAGGSGFTVEAPPPGGYRYRNGDVAMAKAPSEAPGASSSQFFIVATEAGAALLDPIYAVVGHAVDEESSRTIRRIDRLGIDDGPPAEPVYILTARLVQAE
jgi:cyclophilin family peptidyl-prolyl cis-trans isomerase